jgi:NitT/TauT family transport system substrate-binding protein
MAFHRRQILKAGAAATLALGGTLGSPVFAQARTKVRLGYLHTPSVDTHIWIGQQIGAFAAQGIDLELLQFTTGLELSQAMIGGSLDMASMGAVLSNFPARGQGRVFLVNSVELATAQLWVSEASGVKTLADLKGKQVATTMGTTAHVFLDRALRSVNLVPGKDVQIVNQRMTEAVTSFISGAVPSVALWVPFDSVIRQKMPGARKVIDASAFFPQAAIIGGWAARNDYYDKNPEVIGRVAAAWGQANAHVVSNLDAAAEQLQKSQYKDIPLADFKEQFKASRYYSNAEWRRQYQDGTVERWLQQVTDFFVQSANIPNPLKASQYFDPKPFLSAVKA